MTPIIDYINKFQTRTAAASDLNIDLVQLKRFEKLGGYVRDDGEIYLPRRKRGVNRIPRKVKAEAAE